MKSGFTTRGVFLIAIAMCCVRPGPMQDAGGKPPAATEELRVRRIVIVDGGGKEVGWIEGRADGATIRLGGVRDGDGVSPQILLHTTKLPSPHALGALQQDPKDQAASCVLMELAAGTATSKACNAEGDVLMMQSAARRTERGVALTRKTEEAEQRWPQ
ncbi:MAG: hypothetical protein ACK58T_37430 [Phycisphaerae bacterium]